MNIDKLVIKSIRVDQGIRLKRAIPRAKGRATLIEKKMSHVALELEENDQKATPEFVIHKKVKKESKLKEDKAAQTPKPKFEEPKKKEKAKKGFGSKVFRRKSI